MIIAIFAVDRENGIGNQGTIPWPFNKEDMRWFKEVTERQIVVMGKRSWESPDMPKPLPKRHNVVFTNSIIDNEDITQIKGDVCEGLMWLQDKNPDLDIFVIGGADLLMQAKPVIERAFITRIPETYICDTYIDLDLFIDDLTLVDTNDLGTCKVEEYEAI
jgi:dihydrofolate reductase